MKYRRFTYLFFPLIALVGLLQTRRADAQNITDRVYNLLQDKEDSLKEYSYNMVFNDDPAVRFRSDSNFIRTFVRALVTPNSFYYPFDSLNISRLYAPDSSFRIFTWQLKKDEYVFLQKGAIQMNTPGGELKLFPLFDVSMFTRNPEDSVRDRNQWIGAIYYRILMTEYNGKKYYTLLGFDDYSIDANKKWIEVLTFNNNGQPQFGGNYFSFKNDSISKPVQKRFNIEYKKDATTTLNFDPNKNLIVFDHLVSESDQPGRKSTYIPDGEYEAFKWEKGQWVHIEKLEFDFRLKDGEFPTEALMMDDAGNENEQLLEEASRRNMEKANQSGGQQPPPPPEKKKVEVKKKKGNGGGM